MTQTPSQQLDGILREVAAQPFKVNSTVALAKKQLRDLIRKEVEAIIGEDEAPDIGVAAASTGQPDRRYKSPGYSIRASSINRTKAEQRQRFKERWGR